MIRAVLWVSIAFFPISEIVLTIVRRSGKNARGADRGSMLVNWLAIGLGVGLAIAAEWVRAARMDLPRELVAWLGLAFIICGLVIRWTAIFTLGRFFTVDVAIHDRHAVVQTGVYRFARHPSYTGMMLVFVGTGLAFYNWLSLLCLLLPITLAVANRIRHEERTLVAALGAPYIEYCARTKRLIPGVF